MTTVQPSEYHHINDLLQRIGTSVEAAECHGLLTGLLCAQEVVDSAAWISYILANVEDREGSLTEEAHAVFSALLGRVLDQLNDPEYGFELMLPDDESSLAERTTALAEWCQSFLLGLSMGGIQDVAQLPDGSREIIHDMMEITRAEIGAEDGSEEDEHAFAEIVEYIRMGVLLIREEIRAVRRPRPSDAVVH